MKQDGISKLFERYLNASKEGKEPYFDADQIDQLLDSFEESEDYTHYDKVLALGLKLHPNNTDLKIRECKLYLYNEEYNQVLNLIELIAETNNEDLDIMRLECYCALNEYGKVVEYIEKLVQDQCEYLEEIFEYLGPVLCDFDQIDEARDFIDRGLLLFPNNSVLKDELCYILELEGNFPLAIKMCNELIDKNPYSSDYWFTLGRLHSLTGEFEKAIEAFDFALTCDDSDVELKILKAYCLFMNENYQKAIDVYTEIAIDEDSIERIKPLMAECYIKLEKYEESFHLLHEIISKKDTLIEASTYINYIRCCVETDRERKASEALLRAADLFPDNVRILSLLALSYLEKGKEELALSITDKIFSQLDTINNENTDDCEKLLQKGQLLFIKGDFEKALKYYKKILEINPQMPFMHIHMAMAYFSLGDVERFGKHYRKASEKEIVEYMKTSGLDIQNIGAKPGKIIPPEELTKEYLNNKDNSN